ncbi:MAG: 16S rRNA (uracil(1498)-N(3))-methyltransferase [Clostridia bacterium]|nr:16S rRNA (uracil(1498)-N(3))-methyltransferase [Clostridia bacterium]
MHRFFVNKSINDQETEIVIDHESDVRHIVKALRVQIEEKLEIVDANGEEYVVSVKSLGEEVICEILEKLIITRESPIEIDLYQGLAKGTKMETIIQKAVELGVHKVYPVSMKRSIVKLDEKSSVKKIERWQAIADEAAKQSKRSNIPVVEALVDMKNIKSLEYDLILIAYELESQKNLHQILESFSGKKIAVFIGPEGGFEEDEVNQILNLGGNSISLGKRILRTETAGMMLISILQYALGDVY